MILLVVFLSGCSGLSGLVQPRTEASTKDPHWQVWREGIVLYEQGHYKQAQEIFEKLSHVVKDQRLRRNALYSLSCSMLATADTRREVEEAVEHWKLWTQLRATSLGEEDPLMLDPFLERIEALMVRNSGSKTRSKRQRADHCNELVREKDRKIEELKHQLQELEAIHLNIQQKKDEVSSP